MFTRGLLVNDRYRLDAPIAAGGMGQVWRATDTVLGRTVAVKLLHRLVDDTTHARFRNEARAMAALQHPGVADVYDYGETELTDGTESAYIVMACVEGQPLSRHIAEAGILGTAETRSIIAQAARALQAVHDAGVVHRDVKPGNLIIEPDGTVILIDFGVAVTADTPGHTRADEVVGTALYMAPEQVAKQALTPATDVYALGAVAYHCLAGRPPFDGDNAITVAVRHLQDQPPPLPDDVPTDLRHLVATAMAKDPAQRYPTAGAMADASQNRQTDAATVVLGAARAALPMTEPPPRTPPAPARHRAVGLLLAALAAVLAVLVLADPIGVLPLPDDHPRPPAATTDVNPAGDDPAGGAGGEPQTTSDPGTSPGPPGSAPAGRTAPDDREPTPDPSAPDDQEPAEPTPSVDPPSTGPSTPDSDETDPADPEPSGPNGEASPEPAGSPAGQVQEAEAG
jgi:serine/threonine-protein kinase